MFLIQYQKLLTTRVWLQENSKFFLLTVFFVKFFDFRTSDNENQVTYFKCCITPIFKPNNYFFIWWVGHLLKVIVCIAMYVEVIMQKTCHSLISQFMLICLSHHQATQKAKLTLFFFPDLQKISKHFSENSPLQFPRFKNNWRFLGNQFRF